MALLHGAFWEHLHYSAALELDFHTLGQFQANIAFAQFGDLADHAASGDDFVAFGQCVDHAAVFFLLFHLWTDHHKVQHDEHEHQGQHAHQAGLYASRGGGGGGGLGESGRNKHKYLQI